MILQGLNDYASYLNYFKDIATKHKQLNGYVIGDEEEVSSEMKKWSGLKLWIEDPDDGRGDGLSENTRLIRRAQLVVCGPCSNKKYAEERDFYQNCEVIAKQILARMNKDYKEQRLAHRFSFMFQRGDSTISGTTLIGCVISLSWEDYEGFEYNEENWND